MSKAVDTTSMRYALYEEPGPRTKRRIRVATVIALALVAWLVYRIIWRFSVTGQLAPKYWSFFTKWSTWKFLLDGLLGTVGVSLTAGVLALVWATVLMLGRISERKWLSTLCRVVINFNRGVPSLLLIYFFFLVVPQYGVKMQAFWMIALPVAITASGVLAEVLRAGVNAVPKGQTEAALSLGYRHMRIMLKIVLPQALKIVIPSLVSQLVVVVKDTTLGYVVSYPDMLQNARVLITNYDALVSTYFVVAIIYILINYAINQLSVYLARRSGTKIVARNEENPI